MQSGIINKALLKGFIQLFCIFELKFQSILQIHTFNISCKFLSKKHVSFQGGPQSMHVPIFSTIIRHNRVSTNAPLSRIQI
ncbi:hypothetical protein GOP47_0019449 [Adiantum capillus-veneris]|uniref:Uncharacterized protein n=1 Tax=Adiantum capillus-veneris TaxID=13818 RepID=A0A9D4UCL1_ADICA|nr:hypothetical protein GOP47_0019449 [Adiantum capillus-veneris]